MELLREQGKDEQQIKKLWRPLRKLVQRFKDAQNQQVDYLEIRSFSAQHYGKEELYREAVVNIFTRLNAGGRTLTREEITFAWIKVEWDANRGVEPLANEAFEDLRGKLRAEAVELTTDDLVRLLSVVWAAAENRGRLLSNRDLLDGKTLRQLAHWLRKNWNCLDASLCDTVENLRKQGLLYGQHYRSLNALALLLALRHLGDRWRARHPGLDAGSDLALAEGVDQFLETFAERWLVISQWAGVWAQSTDGTMPKYLKDLGEKFKGLTSCSTSRHVLETMRDLMRSWLSDLQKPAIDFINRIEVQGRAGVSQYFLPLWVWQRDDPSRAEQSRLTLREVRSRAAPRLEVDHIVPYAVWENLRRSMPDEDTFNTVNQLGNTALLSKTFNISKNKTPIDQWLNRLEQVPGFDLNTWENSLLIGPELASELTADRLEVVCEAIRQRTARTRADLVTYIEASVDQTLP